MEHPRGFLRHAIAPSESDSELRRTHLHRTATMSDLTAEKTPLPPSYGGKDLEQGVKIKTYDDETDDNASDILQAQIASEEGLEIQYRTCSWQKVRPCHSFFYGECFP